MKMISLRIILIATAATLASCEPPIHGLSTPRHQPSSSYGTPQQSYSSNAYLPPSSSYGAPSSSFSAPSSSYGAPSSSYGAPSSSYGAPSSSYGAPSSGYASSGSGYDDGGHGHGHDHEEPKSYEFGYSVKDAHSGNDYDRHETSDGNTVRGEYRVQLPDGRTQIVSYHADWKTGFHADVRYEGEARYPEPSYQGSQGGYNYPDLTSNSLKSSYGPPGY